MLFSPSHCVSSHLKCAAACPSRVAWTMKTHGPAEMQVKQIKLYKKKKENSSSCKADNKLYFTFYGMFSDHHPRTTIPRSIFTLHERFLLVLHLHWTRDACWSVYAILFASDLLSTKNTADSLSDIIIWYRVQ